MGFIRLVSGWCSSALIRSDQLSAVCVLAPAGDQENQPPPKYTVTLALRKIYLFICLQYPCCNIASLEHALEDDQNKRECLCVNVTVTLCLPSQFAQFNF